MKNDRTARLFAVFSVLAAIAYVGCGGDDSNPQGSGGPAADVTIQIVAMNGSNSYSPNPATVSVGQTVAWRNADNQGHSATANGGEFNTGILSPGQTSGLTTFAAPDTIAYHCTPHPTMVGTLMVTP
jgi:plastocyanin